MKLLKKFKKLDLYIRMLLVYLFYMLIKWICWEAMNIEIGREGFSWKRWIPSPPPHPSLMNVVNTL